MTTLLQLLTAWLGSFALWLLFVYQLTASELIAAAAASAVTVISACVILRIIPACFQPRLRWIIQIYRLPAMVAAELWILFRCLLRDLSKMPSRSSFVVTGFRPMSDDCHAAAQRALAVLFVSVTPNSVVLDIDTAQGRMFYHQVEPAPVPKLVRRLEE